MTPFAVDANAIALFQKERISRQEGEGAAAVNAITSENCIALDATNLCLQEWLNAASGSFPFALQDWINDMIATGKIRLYPLAPNDCRKRLLSYGLPQDDHKWVRLALGCRGNVIVTGDVDFFDPAKKKHSAEVKLKIRSSGRGSCSKALLKDFAVEVVDTSAVPAYFAA